MKYWWVNHNQTVEQEVNGGYLWSPKTEQGGKRSQFYDNMRRARPGDPVLSFARSHINNVGRVSDFAFSSPKPEEFGTKGSYWDQQGWLLPVVWKKLNHPYKPANDIEQLESLLPKKYSPFVLKTGRGSQKAYLAEVSPELYSHVVGAAGGDPQGWDASLQAHLQAIDQREVVDDAIEVAVKSDTALETTEKEALVKSRRGQGLFRERVEELEGRCRVTGLSEPALLIAGHIKPWRSCESAVERLDGYNGFLLAPHIDRLFDRGFISFADDGVVIVSTLLASSVIECLQLSAQLEKNVGPFSEQDLASRLLGLFPASRT